MLRRHAGAGRRGAETVGVHDARRTRNAWTARRDRRLPSSLATRRTTSGQLDENDNNKNREYDVVDRRIKETYAKDSDGDQRKQDL